MTYNHHLLAIALRSFFANSASFRYYSLADLATEFRFVYFPWPATCIRVLGNSLPSIQTLFLWRKDIAFSHLDLNYTLEGDSQGKNVLKVTIQEKYV